MKRKSLVERFRYRFDNFFSKGGWSIFQALIALYLVTFLLMGGVRVLVNYWIDGNTAQTHIHLWDVMVQIMDIGSLQNDQDSTFYNKVIGFVTSILGLTLISTMLAFVTSIFKEKLEELKKGKSSIIEADHTLILGFGNRALEILRELVEANESESDAAVVVLCETDKEEMDDFFNLTLTHRGSTRVITRSGAVSSPLFLTRMGLLECKSVILLNHAQTADSPELKNQADYRVLKTIMAILSATEQRGQIPPVVAQFHYARNRELALDVSPGNIIALDEDLILSKILVQTSRSPGLSLVYSDLVGFVGNEVYFSEPAESVVGLAFGELIFYFDPSVPLGIRNLEGGIELNPPQSRVLEAGEELIILAEDDSTIHYLPQMPVVPTPRPLSKDKPKLTTERFLILGWSKKSPILIHEYASYLLPGSTIDVVVKELTPEIKQAYGQVKKNCPNIKLRLAPVDMAADLFPRALNPESYDNVIILATEGRNIEEIDAEILSLLLKFRHYFKKLEQEQGRAVTTQLISEVMDSANLEIIQQAGVKDFLISNQFVSKIMAQISEEPRVNKVYEQLFQAEGSEIYLKAIGLYLADFSGPIPFADLMWAALQRGEVCFGVKLAREEKLQGTNFGTYILPTKGREFELEPEDRLIVLALDQS
ncbi:MAG: hypothetical protein A2600_09550 [Candidatus Lambdaproteobacteria bacterium RIFOXYD1_FULL_56_27]|uniref:CASTOR/POLLUX/SYM8 ion channel conserved domain-containing protein n=1 Tax=Candidatus Lambdaproteobacteria bacterium RIFOXYD2_FULL_56_26 TaxID=1817773 RepID=A0A1F6GUP7_9PROT|nr:MAG: hypothetical protein A2557_04820 [Candidatus Lambdaproteobacteria bacterium RIFOXYD2_FULL_56_26]OGH02291.1 MAG: hypothetical protein A2426_03300 [Candidatus Lambdaproteobacteria bacterium RIFOXYC1_FULL_56_13]OGH10061.1 MAG: hypothetical protein A2600_09550 [Candidatus Lambdaproteobacteria bacterium RIFOXYD1_FULL_56_27]